LLSRFFPINSIQTLTFLHTITLSPPLPSSHVFPSLAFHKERLLWKLRGYMTGQRGRQRIAKKHGLSGCQVDLYGYKVDHQGLFRPGNKLYSSSLPPFDQPSWGKVRFSFTPKKLVFLWFFYFVDLVLPHCNCMNNYINKMRLF